MSRFNRELFELIEKRGKEGITSREVAEILRISRRSARTWLSKFTNYRGPDGKAKRYLMYNPPPEGSPRGGKNVVLGTYTIGPDEWIGMLYNRTM